MASHARSQASSLPRSLARAGLIAAMSAAALGVGAASASAAQPSASTAPQAGPVSDLATAAAGFFAGLREGAAETLAPVTHLSVDPLGGMSPAPSAAQ